MRIDPEFQALIPPLSDDEYAALELSIIAEGCRDAIVVWQHDGDDIIVDGHNRYAICTAAGLPYNTVTRDFSNRSEVMLWMIRNQLARRNLTPFKRTELALWIEDILSEQARHNSLANLRNNPLDVQNSAHREQGRTRDAVARIAEVSHDTVHKVKQVLTDAPAPIVDKARAGDISIHAAERMTKALRGQPDDVVELALRLADDSADKVAILARLYKSNGKDGSNATFDEIATNGGFHYGDEMDDWCDFAASSARQIEDALRSLEKYHQVLAMQEKDAARDARNTFLDEVNAKVSQVIGRASSVDKQYQYGDRVTIGKHLLICADNRELADELKSYNAVMAFADPPYNANAAEYDDGSFEWQQDFLIDAAPIVAVTPGIGNIPGLMQATQMPYKWSTSTHISNGMTRGALGFGNWIYTAIFSHGSIHKNAQDIATVAIYASDSHDNISKRQKPPRYLAWLFGLFAKEGDVIIDAFGGSGAAVLVAEELGLKCICIEKDAATFTALVNRVQEHINADAI